MIMNNNKIRSIYIYMYIETVEYTWICAVDRLWTLNIVVAVNIQEDFNFSLLWFIQLIIENIKKYYYLFVKSNFIGNIKKLRRMFIWCSCPLSTHIKSFFNWIYLIGIHKWKTLLKYLLFKMHGSIQRNLKSQVYHSEWWPVEYTHVKRTSKRKKQNNLKIIRRRRWKKQTNKR